ncbi:MAG: hypothetical protein EZS28_049918 [Streblomastix strix]|uniref:Thioredoxin domain-containing protein n=1 Tax=Streblomastix strix TaxID=222440 RepID=A0A5J4TAU3_9EUKA|nr:MAG: hypothetical protein EZS28_049918 [Streblomastix strix]
MEPEWNLASESAPDGVAYANIDGESVKKLQKQIGISGYPSLVIFYLNIEEKEQKKLSTKQPEKLWSLFSQERHYHPII